MKTNRIASLCAICLILVLLCGMASAGTTYSTSGSSADTSIFFAYSYGNAKITLSQQQGRCREQSSSGYSDANAWGKYRIQVTNPSRTNYSESWDGTSSYTLSLSNKGYYMIQVIPYSASEMSTDWAAKRFVSWTQDPTWWISARTNCGQVGSSLYRSVTVVRRDMDTNTVLDETEQTVCFGSNTINAPAAPSGYTLSTPASVRVEVYSNGELSPQQAVFYYRKNAASTRQITVEQRDIDSSALLNSRQVTVKTGANTVYAGTAPSGYTLATASSQIVTMYTNGTVSADPVTFYYRRNTPTSRQITVEQRDIDTDALLNSRQVIVKVGNNTVNAGTTPSGYTLATASSQIVTMYTNGTVSADPVTFYFRKNAPTSRQITVEQRDLDTNALLNSRQVIVKVGNNTVNAGTTPSGYTLATGSSQIVTMYTNGSVSADPVTFYFRKNTPTSRQITVEQRDIDTNALLNSRQVTVKVGNNTVSTGTAPSGYTLATSSSQIVTMYNNGSVSTDTVTFYYRKNTPTTRQITVEQRDIDTSGLLNSRQVTVKVGNNTVNAGTAPSGYTLATSSSQVVTMYNNGSVSTDTVTFYYRKNAPTSRQITVEQRDIDNNALLNSRQVIVKVGNNSVNAGTTPSGYTLATAATQIVTMYSDGSVSSDPVTFYFRRNTPTSRQITVEQRDIDTNALLNSRQVIVKVGNSSVNAGSTPSGYALATAATQIVTMYSDGSVNMDPVVFYFRKNTPTSRQITVEQRDYESGALLGSRKVTVQVGSNNVSAGTAPSGYTLTSGSTVQVTMYNNGSVNIDPVTFYYRKSTPTSKQITVEQRDSETSKVLSSWQVTLKVGNNTIASGTTPSGYSLISASSVLVTMYVDGTLSQNGVVFYYSKTPVITATITVEQRDVDSEAVLASRTVTLNAGNNAVPAGNTPSGYKLHGSATTQNVYVDAGGTPSESLVVFYYQKTTPDSGSETKAIPTGWTSNCTPDHDVSQNLYKLYDGSAQTVFVFWPARAGWEDGTPTFTAYFNNATVSAIGIINSDPDHYWDRSRPRVFEIVVHTTSGDSKPIRIDPYDKRTTDYHRNSFGQTYTNVTSIDVRITGIQLGNDRRNEFYNHSYLADLCFFE